MYYRTAEGELIEPQKKRVFWTGGVRYPQLALVRWDQEGVLDSYGAHKVEFLNQPMDERWWHNVMNSDVSEVGVEKITYTFSPRLSVPELRTIIEGEYYSLAGRLAVEIERQLILWSLIRPGSAIETAWLNKKSELAQGYTSAVQAFQAAVALATDEARYAAVLLIYQNLSTYLPDLNGMTRWN